MGYGLCVDVENVRINWLPFDDTEANSQAFGTKVRPWFGCGCWLLMAVDGLAAAAVCC